MKKYPQVESFDEKRVVILGDNLYMENKGNSIVITNGEKVVKKLRQKYSDGDIVRCDSCYKILGTYKQGWDVKEGTVQRGQGRGERLLNFCNEKCAERNKLKEKKQDGSKRT